MKNKKKVVLIVLGFSICLLIGGAYLYLGKKETFVNSLDIKGLTFSTSYEPQNIK